MTANVGRHESRNTRNSWPCTPAVVDRVLYVTSTSHASIKKFKNKKILLEITEFCWIVIPCSALSHDVSLHSRLSDCSDSWLTLTLTGPIVFSILRTSSISLMDPRYFGFEPDLLAEG